MNSRLSLEFGQTHARVRLEKSPHIRNADALEIDWADALPPTPSVNGLCSSSIAAESLIRTGVEKLC